jgi:hypothetical protein
MLKKRLSDICRKEGRILGCERAYARSHPKMRGLITGISKEPVFNNDVE